ncbi:MAG: ATP-binding protein, partial [Wolbachia sp.]
MINEKIVRENLKKVIEQKSGKDVIALGIISSIIIKGQDVGFVLEV